MPLGSEIRAFWGGLGAVSSRVGRGGSGGGRPIPAWPTSVLDWANPSPNFSPVPRGLGRQGSPHGSHLQLDMPGVGSQGGWSRGRVAALRASDRPRTKCCQARRVETPLGLQTRRATTDKRGQTGGGRGMRTHQMGSGPGVPWKVVCQSALRPPELPPPRRLAHGRNGPDAAVNYSMRGTVLRRARARRSVLACLALPEACEGPSLVHPTSGLRQPL